MVSFFLWRKLDDVPVIVSLPLNSIDKLDYFIFMENSHLGVEHGFLTHFCVQAEAVIQYLLSLIKLSWQADL